MTETLNKKEQKARAALVEHFSAPFVSQERAQELESMILCAGQEVLASPRHSVLTWSRNRIWTTAATALATAALAIFSMNSYYEEPDIISELSAIPSSRSYPADFDLEGDASAFSSVVQEVFPNEGEGFATTIPAQIAGKYLPSEGRFFTWAGGPGVSIRLSSRDATKVAANSHPHTVLYIVKLSGKFEKDFPREAITRRVSSSSGKDKKVQVWREGPYGYAVIQN